MLLHSDRCAMLRHFLGGPGRRVCRPLCRSTVCRPNRPVRPLLQVATGRQQSNGAFKSQATAVEDPQVSAVDDLPKNFEPSKSEERIYNWWESNGYFQPDGSAPGEPFVISMPPPNVTGKLHMGHAMFVAIQDIMTRHARMSGRQTLWLPGTDHAGIATQSVVEKMLAKEGLSRQSLGRDAFLEKVWEWRDQYGGFITNQLRRLGASCDWSRERFTLDPGLSEAVAEAFVRLHAKGLVYRGKYMVNWSPLLGTAVSDLEVEYSQEQGTLYYFKYPIAGGDGAYLPVATTRPETILGDSAVAVHPEDERYKQWLDRECEVPSTGRRIPIIADPAVDREFGTGALKITPGHDPVDYAIGARHGLPVITIMNKDATLNALAGKYAGMDRFVARQALWADLEAAGLAIKKEPHNTRVPRSQRGGEIIEPLVSEQWFVRMAPLAEPALAAVASGELRILPDRFEKIYNQWLGNIQDWCVSRQLWWGHRIPVWYVFESEAEAAASADGRAERFLVARNGEEALNSARQQFGAGVALRQEEDVLDTWFSSGLWPFSTLGWPNLEAEDLKRFYPTHVMETGHDILFFWVARMVMMGLEFTGRLPFSVVYLHGLVRDEQGRKMSKSLGNVIDPLDVIAQYGTDALRYTLVTGTTVGQDLNLSEQRLLSSRNLANKLWNAGRFILANLQQAGVSQDPGLAAADFSGAEAQAALPMPERWVIGMLHMAVDDMSAAFDRYDYGEAGRLFYEFFWNEFADWFIESAKPRLYSTDVAVASTNRAVLVYCFDRILRLAHPFMPYITEELWQAMPHQGPALIAARWPTCNAAVDTVAVAQYQELQAMVRAVRNARAEYGVEPARKVPGTIRVQDDALRDALAAELQIVGVLAKLDTTQLNVTSTRSDPASSSSNSPCVTVVVCEGLEVVMPMAGLFDAAKELARLAKQKAKIEKEAVGLQARLSNPSFVGKAAPEVVAEVQKQYADVMDKVAAVEAKMKEVQALQQ